MTKKLSFILHSAHCIIKEKGLWGFVLRLWSLIRYFLTPSEITLTEPADSLDFKEHPAPRVSIIIPVHNNSRYTYNCLASILKNTAETPFEVIIVDDASTDDTQTVLTRVKNIKIIRNQKNLGFVQSCNAGAAVARGDFLHFLNNDTIVTSGWLSSLVSLFQDNQTIGAAGSKLLYPNMILQEAGSIIWQDGSASNYGKFDRASKPQYNYLREADYCSGASLMVKKDIFNSIGGFSLDYSPAYWEDVDLCFAVRSKGYKVLYQPDSVVVHFEGLSAGTDLSPGMKKFQKINSEKFKQKWKAELEKHSVKKSTDISIARNRHGLSQNRYAAP